MQPTGVTGGWHEKHQKVIFEILYQTCQTVHILRRSAAFQQQCMLKGEVDLNTALKAQAWKMFLLKCFFHNRMKFSCDSFAFPCVLGTE